MKSDIPDLPVAGIKVAIARKPTDSKEFEWHVYIINNNLVDLDNVLITSRGYSDKKENEDDEQKTSVLRHMIEKLQSGSYAIIEPIDPQLFHLFNEFWISYYIDGHIYDKKFVFVPESITEEHIMKITELGLEGVLHS